MYRYQSGFTIIELVIASSIGIFLMGAILQVFSQSQTTIAINQSVNEIQDRGRTLLHHLSFNIKQRGYQGCLPPMSLDVNDVDSIDWDNSISVTPLATQLPNAPYAQTSLRGFEVSSGGQFSPAAVQADMLAVQNGIQGKKPRPHSDVVQVQFGDRRSIALASSMDTELSGIELSDNSLNFAVGDIVMIGDCTSADIFEITSITVAGSNLILQHAAGQNRDAQLSKPYGTDARVRRFNAYTYFISDSGRTNNSGTSIYSLYRADQNQTLIELADGVDFLQVSYKQQSSLGIQDLTADNGSFDPMKVVGMDIGLLVVGIKDVLSKDDTKVYRLPGASVGPGENADYGEDRLLKAPFRTHIDIKNRA